MKRESTRATSRRTFLAGGARLGLGLCILPEARAASGYPANERLGVALIGVSGRGQWFVGSIPNQGERVVAMCDVNERRAAESFAKFPDVPKFKDFRVMLDKQRDVEAVVVATPDNTHAAISLAAMKAGKHVYCEKPLTHDVAEARALSQAAAGLDVATQMGNQGTASEGFRRSLELVRSGVIGTIEQVFAWKDGGGWGERQPPSGSETVPPTLAWDLWLGPAAVRPYHSQWMKWHGWRDFGTGVTGNWACHTTNLAFKALRLDEFWTETEPGAERPPERRLKIEVETAQKSDHVFPRRSRTRFRFPTRGESPPLTFTWFEGLAGWAEERARVERAAGQKLDFGDAGRKKWDDHAACLIVGSEGVLHLNGHNTSFRLGPEEKFRDYEKPARFVLRSPGHEREWTRAAKGGERAMSHFGYSGPLTEFVLLVNLATRFGRPLEFDPAKCAIVGDDEANRALSRPHREGWAV